MNSIFPFAKSCVFITEQGNKNIFWPLPLKLSPVTERRYCYFILPIVYLNNLVLSKTERGSWPRSQTESRVELHCIE